MLAQLIKNRNKERELNAIALGFTHLKDTTYILPKHYNTGFRLIDLDKCGKEKMDIMKYVASKSTIKN